MRQNQCSQDDLNDTDSDRVENVYTCTFFFSRSQNFVHSNNYSTDKSHIMHLAKKEHFQAQR